ncbi:DUF2214 domain-containing protein [Phyllobacterium sp. P5_D12]
MEFLQALSEWPGAVMLRRFQIAYLLVNAAHILSIGLVLGAIITLDLRILGLFRQYPIGALGPPLSRVAATGVVIAILTGLMLFSVRPIAYIHNPAFLIKVGIVGLGIANALLLNQNRHWRLALMNKEPSRRVQLSAFLSMALWVSAIIAGRWIGFL